MQSLIINALDTKGGAARAAYRLHHGLSNLGAPSRMLVQTKTSDDLGVLAPPGKVHKLLGLARPALDAGLARVLARSTQKDFYPALLPFSPIMRQVRRMAPDIVNLHWVCGGMLRIEEIAKLPQPLVWTLHDMWPFTGGCNYSGTCEAYQSSCGDCPQLRRSGSRDLSYRILKRKQRALQNLDLTAVSPSRWLAAKARRSRLFADKAIEVIPYGLDLQVYRPIEKNLARSLWGFPQGVPLILFGAVQATNDRRKGFDLLQTALAGLRDSGLSDAYLVVFGAGAPPDAPELYYPHRYTGAVADDVSLCLLYSAADVTVIPSREDNLPNVAIESLACGTPVVGFDVGGMNEIVVHGANGFLAEAEQPSQLADGIRMVLRETEAGPALQQRARAHAEGHFALELSARRYLALFEELLLRAGKARTG